MRCLAFVFRGFVAVIALGCAGCSMEPDVPIQAGGDFVPGEAEVVLLRDGRNAKLLKTFVYTDGEKLTWTAPAGEVVDGASIPQLFWSVIGGPYEGRYRYASIVHDRYCREHDGRSWKQVHRMFYEACLAAGTEPRLAKLMYAAIYNFGPRWDDATLPAGDLENLISVERLRVAVEVDAAAKIVPKSLTDDAPSRHERIGERAFVDLVLAPRPPGMKAVNDFEPSEVAPWDRLRALIRDNPDVPLNQLELDSPVH